MAIYRGSGGSGDATADTSNTSAVAIAAANDAQDSANAAAASAVTASNAATSTAGSVAAAATSATNAATSASTATTQAGIATTKASEASTSATNAATSATNAASSATSASGSATTATTKASEASTSATNAATSASSASTSATSASSSASTATTKASEASTSATNAAASATTATTQATNAASSATSASGSATTATTQASAASTSAINAASSASAASTSATSASTSATTATTQAGIATTQATNSATSAAASAAARDAALAALDSFDDRYLGTKSADPTLDNDGNALVSGALYFNTVSNSMKVYDGSLWLAAYASLSGALLSANNLSDVTSVSSSRTNLGLGTMATQDASSVAITGGTLNGTLGATTPSTAVVTSLTDSGLTSGRVTFASTGGLLADSANFVWDNTNARLGIGTASPAYKLDVAGAINTSSNISFTGSGSLLQASQAAYTRIIGGTTANVDSTITLYGSTNANTNLITYDGGSHRWRSVSGTERMRIDASGNLGLGVTPSAWGSQFRAQQIGVNSFIAGRTDGFSQTWLGCNSYYDGTNWKYISTTLSTQYLQISGTHQWFTAPTGTAGNAITFTQAMTLDASGYLGVGTTSPSTYTARIASYATASVANIALDAASGQNVGINWYTNGTARWATQVLGDGSNAYRFYDFTAGAERMRIDASGNLGIGTASPSSYYANQIVAYNAARSGITVACGTNAVGDLAFADGTTGNDTYRGLIRYDHSVDSMSFWTAASAKMTLDASGNLLVGTTSATSGGAKLQTADGITFPATQVASANANTLDDYEEGTWTPSFQDNLNNTATMTVQQGFYTKTGNIVNAWCQVIYSSRTALTGSYAKVSGLPFTAKSNTGGYYYNGAVWMTSTALYPVGCIDGGGSVITFFNASASTTTPISAFNASGGFMISITYFTN